MVAGSGVSQSEVDAREQMWARQVAEEKVYADAAAVVAAQAAVTALQGGGAASGAQVAAAAAGLAAAQAAEAADAAAPVVVSSPPAGYTVGVREAMRAGHGEKRTALQAAHPGQIWLPRGWLRDAPDDRDRMYEVPAGLVVPEAMDLRAGFPPVYSQLGESCESNAVAGAIHFCRLKAGEAFGEPSTQFLFYNARLLVGMEEQQIGTSARQNIKAAARLGLAPYSAWPNRQETLCVRPAPEVYAAAKSEVLSSYARLRLELKELKACLAEGFPFVAAMNWFAVDDETGAYVMPTAADLAGGNASGGHTVLIVGYSDATESFSFRNSWGSGWGDGGYGTMAYAVLTDRALTDDLWTIRG